MNVVRNFLLILTCFIIFSCKTQKKTQKPTWLFGKWERVNKKNNNKTFDFWNKNLTGIGFTLKDSDTIFKEVMSIIELKDTLNLKIEGVNDLPTLFKLTKQTDSSFTCINLKNEFPKKIYYYLDNNQLKCKISNDEFSVDFIFNKITH